MKDVNDSRLRRFANSMQLMDWLKITGDVNDVCPADMWCWANSLLGNGRHADRFQRQLGNYLLPRVLAQHFLPQEVKVWADVPDHLAILLCFEQFTNREVVVHKEKSGHWVFLGTTGAGKTSMLAWIIAQLLAKGIQVKFQCHKGDGRRLIYLAPESAVFRPDQEYWNVLEPIGPPQIYWAAIFSAIARARNIHTETHTELVEVMERIAAGLKPGEPFPSLADFVRILKSISQKEQRPKLATAAQAIRSLVVELGRSAYIRKAPDVDARYKLIIQEYGNLPPRDHHLLAELRLLRSQMKAMHQGHNADFQTAYVSDEGSNEFGQAFSAQSGSNYIPVHDRTMMEGRSFGLRVLIAAQMPSQLVQSVKANASTIVVMQLPDVKEAREGQQLLGLTEDAIEEIRSQQPGQVMVRFPGCTGTVRGWFPDPQLGDFPSDADIASRMKPEFEFLDKQTVFAPFQDNDLVPVSYLEILGEKTADVEETVQPDEEIPQRFFEEHRSLMQEIESHPTASVTEHYSNLGWSAGRGNRVKEQLIEMDLIDSERQKSFNGRPCEILCLTEKGKRLLHG